MKYLVSLLQVVFVLLVAMVIFSFILGIGAAIESENPGAHKNIDVVTGASFLVVIGLAILLSFYEEGMKSGREQEGEEEKSDIEPDSG